MCDKININIQYWRGRTNMYKAQITRSSYKNKVAMLRISNDKYIQHQLQWNLTSIRSDKDLTIKNSQQAWVEMDIFCHPSFKVHKIDRKFLTVLVRTICFPFLTAMSRPCLCMVSIYTESVADISVYNQFYQMSQPF